MRISADCFCAAGLCASASIASAEVRSVVWRIVFAWKKTADRYQSEPETGEGRKELADRAKAAEKKRDKSLAAYHHFEIASAAVQIAIVMASASIITSMPVLVWVAGALGALGIAFCVIGLWFPTVIHLF